ncbi:hypothetical protein BC829DRAFT_402002 [Chytridium lagenaria]|nr:hypothetical protein BC829DRAFT_402002 [Chytridium lagenaria]
MLNFSMCSDGKLTLESELKISFGQADAKSHSIAWIEDGEENTLLKPEGNDKLIFTSASYCVDRHILAGGTSCGNFLLWRKQSPTEGSSLSVDWKLWIRLSIESQIAAIHWCNSGTFMALKLEKSIAVIAEQQTLFAFDRTMLVYQTTLKSVKVLREGIGALDIVTEDPIREISIFGNLVAMSDSRGVNLFEISDELNSYKLVCSIIAEASSICLYHHNIAIAQSLRVDLYNTAGTLKCSIPSPSGAFKFLHHSNSLLATGTPEGLIRIYDLSRREPKLIISHTTKYEKYASYELGVYCLEKDKEFTFVIENTGFKPKSLLWDLNDPKILLCEGNMSEIFSFFVCVEKGIILHDRFKIPKENKLLVGALIPRVFFLESDGESASLFKFIPSDFSDLDESNIGLMSSIVDFCFLIDTGNFDIAFKSLQRIENEKVWKNLAKICLKKGRLDVALLSLGNIGHASAVRALRRLECEQLPQVKCAILAIYLGLYDEVERLLKASKRYDLLNAFFQDCGYWDKALEVASQYDRINLRTTYAEVLGDTFMERNDTDASGYLDTETSRGNYLEAIKYYENADDILSQVRVHSFCGNIDRAVDICKSSNNIASAYFLARQNEKDGKVHQAIELYSIAKCFSQAIRLAKSYGLNNILVQLALQGSTECMIEVAMYFETSGQNIDKAITLFTHLCFQHKQYSLLDDLVDDLQFDDRPDLLQLCSEYFVQNGQHIKAVQVLVNSNKVDEALDLCEEKGIVITEEIADKMTGNGGELPVKSVRRIAELALNQKSYFLACKKFAQKIKAMRALLKSADIERIIFFANVSGPKDKEIFVMAANFLQTLDWRRNPQIMKAIVLFYSKAKSYESFLFLRCYQNYEKALGALKESSKCLLKIQDFQMKEKHKMQEDKIQLIETFLTAKRQSRVEPKEMLKTCELLLSNEQLETIIRVGDVFGLMIETYYAAGDLDRASSLIHEMKRRVSASNLEYYIEPDILTRLGAKRVTTSSEDIPEIIDN